MEVKSTQPTDWAYPSTTAKVEADFSAGNSNATVQEKKDVVPPVESPQEKKPELTKDELSSITRELNKFFQYLNANIRFEMHDRTQRLMVKLVDVATDKVLREFPPEELLDKLANIREYVGVILDKKA